ncbi:hypothetical protein HMPREF1153_0333 [Selenomonas sp. CM52]|nr:hypothetical protein HMPREF1153_0333 [Selenomonas sp. CM52]
MIKKDGVSVHGERRPLADVVPLAMPYALTVFPMRACNFRCFYCRLTQAKRASAAKTSRSLIEYNRKCFMRCFG